MPKNDMRKIIVQADESAGAPAPVTLGERVRETRAAIQAAMDRLASRQRFAIFSGGAQRCRA